jgi:hypothetical protein
MSYFFRNISIILVTWPPHCSREENPDIKLLDAGGIEYPSDSLSIKRLRTMFPRWFAHGRIEDGFGSFFYPMDTEQPEHLVRLNDLLSDERTVAGYAYRNTIDPYPGEWLDEESQGCMIQAKSQLELAYQQFKLADSPETARMLIRHIEEQAVTLAEQHKSRVL